MTYKNGVKTQQWTKEQMDAYWSTRIASKRPNDALQNSRKKPGGLSLSRPSKQAYERHLANGLTEQDIDNRYPNLPIGWQQAAKKRWGLA